MLRTFHLQFCSLPFTSSSLTFHAVILNVFSRASVAVFFHYSYHVFLVLLHLQTLILLLFCILLGITVSELWPLHLSVVNFLCLRHQFNNYFLCHSTFKESFCTVVF